jgi:hypothetical protein
MSGQEADRCHVEQRHCALTLSSTCVEVILIGRRRRVSRYLLEVVCGEASHKSRHRKVDKRQVVTVLELCSIASHWHGGKY